MTDNYINYDISDNKIPDKMEILNNLGYKKDNIKCGYCNGHLSYDESERAHIIPKNSGGSNKLFNLCLAHKACN